MLANDLIITGLVGILLTLEAKPTTKLLVSAALIIVGFILQYGLHL